MNSQPYLLFLLRFGKNTKIHHPFHTTKVRQQKQALPRLTILPHIPIAEDFSLRPRTSVRFPKQALPRLTTSSHPYSRRLQSEAADFSPLSRTGAKRLTTSSQA